MFLKTIMLSNDIRHLCPVPSSGVMGAGNVQFSPLCMMLAVYFFVNTFYQVEEVPI